MTEAISSALNLIESLSGVATSRDTKNRCSESRISCAVLVQRVVAHPIQPIVQAAVVHRVADTDDQSAQQIRIHAAAEFDLSAQRGGQTLLNLTPHLRC